MNNTRSPHLRQHFSVIFREYLEIILVVFAIAISLRLFVFGAYKVSSEEMRPTFMPGDLVIGYKLPFGVRWRSSEKIGSEPPQRFELVVARIDGRALIGRVVGLPGDRVEIRDSQLKVNGTTAAYSKSNTDGTGKIFREHLLGANHLIRRNQNQSQDFSPIVVPPGEAYVLFDNREEIGDSRTLGPIDFRLLEAEASFILFSVYTSSKKATNWRWDRSFMNPN